MKRPKYKDCEGYCEYVPLLEKYCDYLEHEWEIETNQKCSLSLETEVLGRNIKKLEEEKKKLLRVAFKNISYLVNNMKQSFGEEGWEDNESYRKAIEFYNDEISVIEEISGLSWEKLTGRGQIEK